MNQELIAHRDGWRLEIEHALVTSLALHDSAEASGDGDSRSEARLARTIDNALFDADKSTEYIDLDEEQADLAQRALCNMRDRSPVMLSHRSDALKSRFKTTQSQ